MYPYIYMYNMYTVTEQSGVQARITSVGQASGGECGGNYMDRHGCMRFSKSSDQSSFLFCVILRIGCSGCRVISLAIYGDGVRLRSREDRQRVRETFFCVYINSKCDKTVRIKVLSYASERVDGVCVCARALCMRVSV